MRGGRVVDICLPSSRPPSRATSQGFKTHHCRNMRWAVYSLMGLPCQGHQSNSRHISSYHRWNKDGPCSYVSAVRRTCALCPCVWVIFEPAVWSQPARQPVTLNIPWTARKSCRGVPDPQRVKPAALGYTPFLWSWNPAEQIPHLTSGASLLFLDLIHFLTLTSFILDILKSQLIRANWIIVMFLF